MIARKNPEVGRLVSLARLIELAPKGREGLARRYPFGLSAHAAACPSAALAQGARRAVSIASRRARSARASSALNNGRLPTYPLATICPDRSRFRVLPSLHP